MPVLIEEVASQVSSSAAEQPIPKELVTKITELVYALLIEEMRIERERRPETLWKGEFNGRR
jgi:hypothetical protein